MVDDYHGCRSHHFQKPQSIDRERIAGVVVSDGPVVRDRLDRRLLRRHFDLPSGLRLAKYDGYPAIVGLGQREGLHIRAVYQVPERKAGAFERHLDENGWLPLPVPAEIQDKVCPYVADGTLAPSSGWYLCRTAGNDVLHARETRPCVFQITL